MLSRIPTERPEQTLSPARGSFVKALRLSPRSARALVAALLALVCLALFVRQVDLNVLGSIVTRDRAWLILGAISIFLLESLGRAWRWQWLLRPLGQAPLGPLVSFTFIGFASNNLLLARSGELIKPALASRLLGLPFVPALAIGVLERFFDVLGLLGVFILMTLTLPDHAIPGSSPLLLSMLGRLGPLFSLLGLGGICLLVLLTIRIELSTRMAEFFTCRLPERARPLTRRLLLELLSGLRTLRDLRTLVVVVGLSLVMWLNGVLAIWLLFKAFELSLPLSAACFLSATVAVAVVPPQAPGFVGVWQVAVWQALEGWGVPSSQATAFAVVFWVASFVPVGAVGLILFWREGVRLTELLVQAGAEPRNSPAPQNESQETSGS